ncbi:MAG TPA: helix-turn-helix transcriptional regulator [Solirubrobacterales bacterium]|nr:helix-turn-helix transcriptional regulator [Solirubrobacterales bacterium]
MTSGREPQKEFAWAVRKLRTEKGLTQSALARRLGVNPSFVSRLEQGEGNPRWGTARRVAVGLEVTVADLATTAEAFEQRRSK